MKFKKSLAYILSTAFFLSSVCAIPTFAEKGDEIYETAKNPNAKYRLDEFTFDGKRAQSDAKMGNLKLDLFEEDNLNTALACGLEFIVGEDSSPYMDDKTSLVGSITQNELLKENIQSTIDYIKTKKENDNDKNLEIFKRLHTIETIMKNDGITSKQNSVLKFISAMKSAYQLVISRIVAKEILDSNREKLESKMSSEVYGADGEFSSSIPQEGFNIGLFSNIGTEQKSTETSFYTIDNSGSFGISLGTGFENYLSANASCAFGLTSSLIFYSLEEFLDTGMAKGNISFLKLKDEDLKKVISSRKKMQADENTILVKIKTSIEPFLKCAGIVPQSLAFKMPDATYFEKSEKKYGINVRSKLAAEASCLAKAGLNVSTEATLNKIKSYHPYLDLIDENFQVTDYCKDSEDLTTYLKTSKTDKYNDIKKAAETESDKKTPEIIISGLISELKEYNSVLAILADNNSSKEEIDRAKITKKKIEKQWIGNKLTLNRENMLKTAISVGVYLKNTYADPSYGNLFSSLYDEIKNLSLLQRFTNKIFFKVHNNTFNTSRTSNTASVTGKTEFDVPLIGKSSLSITYSDTESPLYTENSQDVSIITKLPIIGGKLYGCNDLKEKIKGLMELFSAKTKTGNKLFAGCFELIDKNFDSIVSNHKLKKGASLPAVVSTKDYVTLSFLLTKIPQTTNLCSLIPLPGCKLILKEKDEMILKQTKRIDSTVLTTSLKKDSNGYGTSVNLGKASSKIGSDTLIYIINKFNTCKLGQTSAEESTLWGKFKKSQHDSLSDLFINMTKESSNAKYELQNVYSAIVKNINEKSFATKEEKSALKNKSKNIFREFLDSCEELKQADKNELKSQSYDKASSLLDSILALNYKYVWLNALISANK